MVLEGSDEQPRSRRGQLSQWQRLIPAACQERAAPHSSSARRERGQPRLPRKAHELMHVSAEEQGCAEVSGRKGMLWFVLLSPIQRANFNPGEHMNIGFVN